MIKPLKKLFLMAAVSMLFSCQNVGTHSSDNAISSSSKGWDGIRVEDNRQLDSFAFTQNSITSVDALGRNLPAIDLADESKKVGMFYFLWHGAHETGIYDISKLLANDPDDLWSLEPNTASPVGAFHYWGEPLYGYYQSSDPWIIARHLELLTMAGVDYLVFDTTNAITYANVVNALGDIFLAYQTQGWKVPQIAFYTHSSSKQTLSSIYETWYKTGKYASLWYRIDNKPLIIGVSSDLSDQEYALYSDFFTFKEAQWPDAHINKRDGFPWMDWGYPQTNYSGTMSVSLAQHPGYAMSAQSLSNWGRGFDFKTFKNSSDRVDEGSNFQQEWDTVFSLEGNANPINNVFVTGWNEWMAIKQNLNTDKPIFCDTFNEEYSRDIEMMKGGYGDNYYLQLAENIRRYRGSAQKHYTYTKKTIDIFDPSFASWDGIRNVYRDFEGDAMERQYANCAKTGMYSDTSNRNDIVAVRVCHDSNNVYFRIDCRNPVTSFADGDKNWMNVLINSQNAQTKKFANNFDFAINRFPSGGSTSVERCLGDYSWEKMGSASYFTSGNTLSLSIPLALLGLSENECHFSFKVTDNITHPEDISDYYVSGDSAPIGRLSYDYGY